MSPNDRLLDLFVTALAGEGCSEEGLSYVRGLPRSSTPLEAVWASGVLLAAGTTQEKQQAYERLACLLEAGAICGDEVEFAFLTVLVQTRKTITFNVHFSRFVYRMCASPLPNLRCNAVILLLHFGPSDAESVRLLRQLVDDPDEDVRHNAQVALSLKSDPG